MSLAKHYLPASADYFSVHLQKFESILGSRRFQKSENSDLRHIGAKTEKKFQDKQVAKCNLQLATNSSENCSPRLLALFAEIRHLLLAVLDQASWRRPRCEDAVLHVAVPKLLATPFVASVQTGVD